MTVHAFATFKITNPEMIMAYREKAADALAKHGGSVLQASKDVARLEGDAETPDMAALLAFPDAQHAMDWINDPELSDIHTLRKASGASSIILL